MATKNEKVVPWIATHPGTILKYELEERELSQKEFAQMIDMQTSHLSELIRGKRSMTKSISDKIETVLGISSVSLLNLQTQYEYDVRKIEERGIEEQEASKVLKALDEILCVQILLKALGCPSKSAIMQQKCLKEEAFLSTPTELRQETAGMFKKSSKTGQDSRMLMTWKILAEAISRKQSVKGSFDVEQKDSLVASLTSILHENKNTIASVQEVLSNYGITFCIVDKLKKASVDGYSYIENGVPHIILTKRFDKIDNFAFALLHEVGHIYLHYQNAEKEDFKLSIPDYDNESAEEREANQFAANALISPTDWEDVPKVKVHPVYIQKQYTSWAKSKGFNKWIVLGRIAYETGMYKFKADNSRKINCGN